MLNGNVVIQPQFKALSDVETKFSEDRAFVKANGKVLLSMVKVLYCLMLHLMKYIHIKMA